MGTSGYLSLEERNEIEGSEEIEVEGKTVKGMVFEQDGITITSTYHPLERRERYVVDQTWKKGEQKRRTKKFFDAGGTLTKRVEYSGRTYWKTIESFRFQSLLPFFRMNVEMVDPNKPETYAHLD